MRDENHQDVQSLLRVKNPQDSLSASAIPPIPPETH
jgi:hypothetical protein